MDLSAGQTQASRTAQELEEARQDLERARRERDEAMARLEAVLPDAQAYVQLKERTAGVELEAHRRAQMIQEKAERDAQKLHRQMELWLQRMEREYEALRTKVETTVSHTACELKQVESSLEQINHLMADQEGALEGLSQAYNEINPGRVEAPLPLSEE